jgi:hypothetical protein
LKKTDQFDGSGKLSPDLMARRAASVATHAEERRPLLAVADSGGRGDEDASGGSRAARGEHCSLAINEDLFSAHVGVSLSRFFAGGGLRPLVGGDEHRSSLHPCT